MAAVNYSQFSNSNQYFANPDLNGTLKIWNTSESSLEQQFIPSSHLSATCTCISWSNFTSKSERSRSKKKQKREQEVCLDNQQLIAIGTLSGSLLVYSFAKADLHTKLDGGHTNRVNDICWENDLREVYSCSVDGYIVRWSLEENKVLSKWKNEDGIVHSIALIDKYNLLSASRSISLWDLKTGKVIKQFTGHATEVNRLLPINFTSKSRNDDQYFLSSAADDYLINAWKLQSEETRRALGMFSVNQEIATANVSVCGLKSEPIYIFAVTKSGCLKIFEHQLNGHQKKPLKAKFTVQIASDNQNGMKAMPIAILNAKLIDSQEFMIAHGNFLKPTFERVKFEDCSRNTVLIRTHPSVSAVTINHDGTKIRHPETKPGAKILGPDQSLPMLPTEEPIGANSTKASKRKNQTVSLTEIPMEARMNDVKFRHPSGSASGSQVPQTENMAHLLTQGLQSSDTQMLNNVLLKSGDSQIRNTVRKLPLQYVHPLMAELTKRIKGKRQNNHPYVKWIISLLTNHASYFAMNRKSAELLQPLALVLMNKVELYHRLSRLSGRLELMLSQVTMRNDSEQGISADPLLMYQDDSPEEDDDDDELLRPNHSEDNWDDISDLEIDEYEDMEESDQSDHDNDMT